MLYVKYILLFVGLILLQGLVLNNVLFFGYANPYVYVYFILFITVDVDRALLLVLAFLLGVGIDVFENTGGVHAAACTLLAFARPLLLQIASGKRGREFSELKIKDLPFVNLALYILIAVFIHHLALFTLEAFSIGQIVHVLLRTLFSSLFTFVVLIVMHLWLVRST